jgi:hypothetical protein
MATIRPTAPTTRATIDERRAAAATPSELVASRVGAGVSELSDPNQSTTEPSE